VYRVSQEDLPFKGSSPEFVGAENGDVNVSVFLLSALPGRGPGPHRHPYRRVSASASHLRERERTRTPHICELYRPCAFFALSPNHNKPSMIS
jgi:hypothetical protein